MQWLQFFDLCNKVISKALYFFIFSKRLFVAFTVRIYERLIKNPIKNLDDLAEK